MWCTQLRCHCCFSHWYVLHGSSSWEIAWRISVNQRKQAAENSFVFVMYPVSNVIQIQQTFPIGFLLVFHLGPRQNDQWKWEWKIYNWVTIQIQVPAVRSWSGCKRSYLKTWVSDLLNPLCMSVSWCVRRRYLSSTWLLTHWEHYSSRASCHPDHVDLLTFCVFRHLSLIFVLLL